MQYKKYFISSFLVSGRNKQKPVAKVISVKNPGLCSIIGLNFAMGENSFIIEKG
jgi:hypothetical protein